MREIAAAIACALTACTPSQSPDSHPDVRLNVLLVTVDTLRADRLGTYGYPLDTSPRIDALARNGLVFERAVAASSATAPSHASIMTSRYVRGHSVGYETHGTRLEGTPTLAEVFHGAGYRTAGFVSSTALRRRSGLDAGFEVYDDELLEPERNRSRTTERIADQTTDRALAWLAGRGDAPFFLWVHYGDPHGPYIPPERAEGRFRVRGGRDPVELSVLANDSGYGGIPAYQALPGLSFASHYESRYADEIHYADAEIGRLLRTVDADPLGRETVVLLTGDHGESFGENDRWFVHQHTSTPENALVPLVLRAPGLTPGRVSGVAHHVDVMPTLLALADLESPQQPSGVDLVDSLDDGALPERVVYCDTGREVSAYDAGGFVRVLGVEGAWAPGGAEEEQDPLWVRFRWAPDGSFSREASGGELDREIRRYVSRAVPVVRASAAEPSTARPPRYATE